jgi:hypothetical protein
MKKLIVHLVIFISIVLNVEIFCEDFALAMNIEDYINKIKNPEVYIKDNNLFFYDIKLTTKETDDLPSGYYSFSATCKGETIVKEGGVHEGIVQSSEIEENFPSQGMTTLFIEGWNGGAVCCYERHIFVKNGNNIIYTYLFDERVPSKIQKNNGNIIIYDQRFMHSYIGQHENEAVIFSPATAPYLPRILVFENNAWRVDKVGEMPSEYKKFENEYVDATPSNDDKDDVKTANAYNTIERTFFCLMQGIPDDICLDVLQKKLIKENKSLYRFLWAGVVGRVIRFKPNIDTAHPVKLSTSQQ